MNKWRLEYQIDGSSGKKIWRVYVDVLATATEVFSYTEMRDHVAEDHPVMFHMRWIFRDTTDRVIIKPFEVFDPSPEVIEAPDLVNRIHARDEACKFWSSRDGWMWMHYPGDSIA